MASLVFQPAVAKRSKVVSISVVGSGTPEGPASEASILPVRIGMSVDEPPQAATDRTTPKAMASLILMYAETRGEKNCKVSLMNDPPRFSALSDSKPKEASIPLDINVSLRNFLDDSQG